MQRKDKEKEEKMFWINIVVNLSLFVVATVYFPFLIQTTEAVILDVLQIFGAVSNLVLFRFKSYVVLVLYLIGWSTALAFYLVSGRDVSAAFVATSTLTSVCMTLIVIELPKLTVRILVANEQSRSEAQECVICLESIEITGSAVRLNACRHVFHEECVNKWTNTGKDVCPVCRGKIPEQQFVCVSVPQS